MEQSEAFKATERMKQYIQTHIQEEITMSQLARAAGYSMYHAARLFKEQTGMAPFEYLRKQRLVESAFVLRRKGGKKIVDVAFDYMFSSHEGYTRAFSKTFGITPKRFSAYPKPKDWLILFQTIHRNQEKEEDTNMEKTAIIFTQIVERPKRKLLVKRATKAEDYFSYCEEVGCGKDNNSSAWDVLSQIKEALNEPVGCWLPENMRPKGTSVYVHGVEIPDDYSGEIPKGFDVIDLPPCKMLVFQGEPYDDEQYGEAIDALWERIAKFNPEVYGYEYAYELAPKMQLAPMGWRGYIEMHPIREKK